MATNGYTKTTWVDRDVQYPSRYADQTGNLYTFTASAGTTTESGTALTADKMNNVESGIYDTDIHLQNLALCNLYKYMPIV